MARLSNYEPEIAVIMVGVALGLSMAAACTIEAVEVHKDGQLTCFYGETPVFSGGFNVIGDGLDLDGTWKLCRNDGLVCYLDTKTSSTGDKR